MVFERYSDSVQEYVTLDPSNAQALKQLYRAARAKLKIRVKATVDNPKPKRVEPKPATVEDEMSCPAPAPATKAPQVAETPAAWTIQQRRDYLAAEMKKDSQPIPVYAPSVQPSAPLTFNLKRPESDVPACPPVCRNLPFYNPPVIAAGGPAFPGAPNVMTPLARDIWYRELAAMQADNAAAVLPADTVITARASPASIPVRSGNITGYYSVYCNKCNSSIVDEHFHCGTCDRGDYDLCPSCVQSGAGCKGDHWLIKRFVKNGKVTSSCTEKLPSRAIPFNDSKATLVEPEAPKEAPKIVKVEEGVEEPSDDLWVRTCNACLMEAPESEFITCLDCEDYDLCTACYKLDKHAHHPMHEFKPVAEDASVGGSFAKMMRPGRGVKHNAICDGCDNYIHGVRHKCIDCPDWDYCDSCIKNAGFIHARHRFVEVYKAGSSFLPLVVEPEHFGIYCDGPVCKDKNNNRYIKGTRYKCAVCHDTDFCATCEAHPSSTHNPTHPTIKFKTPVRNVSVATQGDHGDGTAMRLMGDRRRYRAAPTLRAPATNAATQVQTVADLKPVEKPAEVKQEVEAVAEEPRKLETPQSVEQPKVEAAAAEELIAEFVRDTVPDGTALAPGIIFEQTWYLRNGGNEPWPAGCTVKFIGGDNMCANDPDHPASVHELVSAAESTTCYTEVAPRQTHGFTVLMRTPARTGKVVSYWRLTGPNGYKFGHRLWCDVTVEGPAPEVKEEVIKFEEAEIMQIKEEDVKRDTPLPEEPVVIKQEAVEADIKKEADDELKHSQLVFPALAKESPEASLHEAPADISAAAEESNDEFADFTSVAADAESTSEGYLTEEEYDILDASDAEFVVEQEKKQK